MHSIYVEVSYNSCIESTFQKHGITIVVID